MHRVFYTKAARTDIHKLEMGTARRIVKKIAFYSTQKEPLKFAKRMNNIALGEFRFRIGSYRALFDVDSQGRILILMILRIKHRKDIYNLD